MCIIMRQLDHIKRNCIAVVHRTQIEQLNMFICEVAGRSIYLKKQVRVRVTDYTYDRLTTFAKSKGIPVAYIVRLAISDYLSRKGGFRND